MPWELGLWRKDRGNVGGTATFTGTTYQAGVIAFAYVHMLALEMVALFAEGEPSNAVVPVPSFKDQCPTSLALTRASPPSEEAKAMRTMFWMQVVCLIPCFVVFISDSLTAQLRAATEDLMILIFRDRLRFGH